MVSLLHSGHQCPAAAACPSCYSNWDGSLHPWAVQKIDSPVGARCSLAWLSHCSRSEEQDPQRPMLPQCLPAANLCLA